MLPLGPGRLWLPEGSSAGRASADRRREYGPVGPMQSPTETPKRRPRLDFCPDPVSRRGCPRRQEGDRAHRTPVTRRRRRTTSLEHPGSRRGMGRSSGSVEWSPAAPPPERREASFDQSIRCLRAAERVHARRRERANAGALTSGLACLARPPFARIPPCSSIPASTPALLRTTASHERVTVGRTRAGASAGAQDGKVSGTGN